MKLSTFQWIPLIGLPAVAYGIRYSERVDNLFHENDWNNTLVLVGNAFMHGFTLAAFLYYFVAPLFQ